MRALLKLRKRPKNRLSKNLSMMNNNIYKIIKSLKKKGLLIDEIARARAVDIAEQELSELEHVFSLITFGVFIGLPSPPMQITLDLLPLCENEVNILMQKVETANEPLSQLASLFQVD